MAKNSPPGGMAGMSRQQIGELIGHSNDVADAANQAQTLYQAYQAQTLYQAAVNQQAGAGMGGGVGYATPTSGGITGTVTIGSGGAATGLYDPNTTIFAGTTGTGFLASTTRTAPPPYKVEHLADAVRRTWLEKHGPVLLPMAMEIATGLLGAGVMARLPTNVAPGEDIRCRTNASRKEKLQGAINNLQTLRTLVSSMPAEKIEEYQFALVQEIEEIEDDPWSTTARLEVNLEPLENMLVFVAQTMSKISEDAGYALDELGKTGLSGSQFFRAALKFIEAGVRIDA